MALKINQESISDEMLYEEFEAIKTHYQDLGEVEVVAKRAMVEYKIDGYSPTVAVNRLIRVYPGIDEGANGLLAA